jgi:predicted PurR-regulated permease PerM
MQKFFGYLSESESNFRLGVLWAAFAALLIYAFSSLSLVLVPFLLGSVGAHALSPLVGRWHLKGLPRWLASLILVTLIVGLIVLFATIALPSLNAQLIEFSTQIPDVIASINQKIEPFVNSLSSNLSLADRESIKMQLSSSMSNIAGFGLNLMIQIISSGLVIANVLSLLVITPVIMFYALKDWPAIVSFYNQHVKNPTLRGLFTSIEGNLAAYARGQAMACFVLMILYSIALMAIGLKKAIMIGVFTGFFSFIPYVGGLMGLSISIVVALLQFGTWTMPLIIVGIFMVIASIEGNYITPHFVGEKIGLHPILIIFVLFAGATWFGFIGVVLALPASAALMGVYKFYLERKPPA